MITREQVLHIAHLARLKLTEAEIESFTRQLGSILDYVEQLNKVDTGSVEPTSLTLPAQDYLRDDTEKPSLSPEKVLANGPSVKKQHFAVPKVIGD